MEGERLIVIDGIEYRCVFFYGYDSHYYTTVYENSNGKYVGELVDVMKTCGDRDLSNRIRNLKK